MKELTFLRELMLINQMSQECHYWYILDKGFQFQKYV